MDMAIPGNGRHFLLRAGSIGLQTLAAGCHIEGVRKPIEPGVCLPVCLQERGTSSVSDHIVGLNCQIGMSAT